jgi:ribonucleoside-diphosphate reductase alpha chain
MAKEGSTVGGLMDVIGTCTSMALQYGVPLITLVDKFRHARFEPSGMTSNRDIPFAKSLIDYIFCWLGCQFIPGYADKNTPNRVAAATPPENKNTTTAREVVEKTKDLAKKIAEAKTETKIKARAVTPKKPALSTPRVTKQPSSEPKIISTPLGVPSKGAALLKESTGSANRISALVGAAITENTGPLQSEMKTLEQFNAQFTHFTGDAPACDVCGSITVRNGTCYKCFNCGNSMGCS